MSEANKSELKMFFEGQGLHLSFLVVLLIAIMPAWRYPLMDEGTLWGIPTRHWFALVIINAVAHHAWVWLWWRAELHYKLPTRLIGKYAFEVYATPFFIFLSLRLALSFLVAISNQGTLHLPPLVSIGIPLVLMVPVTYLGYSLHRYFGITRAAGTDHFYESHRKKPLVKEGIFRFNANPMYTFGLMILWVPAFYYASFAAMVGAAFSHAFIWGHYFGTERPDLKRIYGP